MDIFSVAMSGMQAAQKLMNTAANNIANSNTPNYQPQQTVMTDVAGGGVQAETITPPAENGGNDLAAQLVSLKQSAFLYKANAMVIKAAAQITGSLLDMMDTDRDRDRDYGQG